MYLKEIYSPQYDVEVERIQLKLNAIKIRFNCDWPTLQADGLFGKQTKEAVMGFQTYKNITPVSGDIGDTTLRYINECYENNLFLTETKGRNKVVTINDKNILIEIVETFKDFIENLNDMLSEEIKIIQSLDITNSNSIKNKCVFFSMKFDSRMSKLQQYSSKFTKINNETINLSLDDFDSTELFIKKYSTLNTKINVLKDSYKYTKINIIAELKKYNLLEKIESTLERKNLNISVSMEKFRKFNPNIKDLKIGLVSIIFNILDLKELITYSYKYYIYKDEEYKREFFEALFSFIDTLILNLISVIISNLIVAGLGTCASISWVAILVVIVVMLIVAFIGYICDKQDISFSRYVCHGIEEFGNLSFAHSF